jgi:hypothetical protein
MVTHILSLTYAPKIPLVKSGECTQTIRLHNPDRPKKVGDKLILHTWAGKPYRTKWDWRLETEISELHQLSFLPEKPSEDPGGMWVIPRLDGEDTDFEDITLIASRDGIVNPSPNRLCDVLRDLNALENLAMTIWEIIRWPKPTIRRVE